MPKKSKASRIRKNTSAPVTVDEMEPQITDTDFYSLMQSKIEDAKNDCSVWRASQEKWHKLRMRIKKTKTFPFYGCANLRMPTVETKLRKLKSNLVKLIFGTRPIVQAIPSPSGNLRTAEKIAKWVDHLIMDIMEFKPKGVIAVDRAIEKGFYLLKPYWRVETTTRIEDFSLDELSIEEAMQLYSLNSTEDSIKQGIIDKFDIDMHDLVAEHNEKEIDKAIEVIQSGGTNIKMEIEDVLYNAPDGALANPEFVYVSNSSGWNPQDTRMATHEFYLPYDQVKRNVEQKGWSQEAVDKISYFKTLNLDNMTENLKDTREGIARVNNPDQLVKIWETYTYYDLNGDGFQEKCLFTFAPEFKLTMRKVTLPMESGKIPLIKIINELTDDRWFSHRGLPELIEDLVKEIDTQHNQKLDSQTWRNTPMWTYRAGVVNPNLIKPVPGQAIPRHDVDDLTMMQNTNLNVDFSYEKEQMILETKIDEMVGQIDFSLQSMINKRQPRTLGEVDAHVSSSAMVFSLDAEMFAMGFSQFFTYIWELWCQYGDDEAEFAYFGQNGWEQIKLSKEEVQGKYKILVRGNDQNYNPQVKQQKAGMILQATMDPKALDLGIVNKQNAYNAYKRFYQSLDIQNWEEYITDPAQTQPLPPPPAQVKIDMEDLTDQEKAHVKSQQNIKPDVQGMAMKKQEEVQDKNTEVQLEVMKNAPRPETKNRSGSA